MYIQEIIIDGFKSYAQKTVVSGFDPQFNAITGLNGTGKSNILDSICFVLGIQNLSQVRVGNLQELVYKQGQAGVTKATVTIIFNNSDVSSSPVGYESHKQITVTRQIVIGGKNKYMINGHNVQQSQLQNMFHSVQLNVNNPHFLIMQGRITKVLNMKPPEILSMIEEAAGTRMFETKKQAAIKTIEKKQLKVDEITKCINEEITPTLENLRNERKDYHTWQSNNTEYERLERFTIAFEFQTAEEKVKSSEADRQSLIVEQDSYTKLITEHNHSAEQCRQRVAEIERLREAETEGSLQELKRREADVSKDVVKTQTLFANQKESLAAEQESLSQLLRQFTTASASLEEKSRELEECSGLVNAKEIETHASESNSTTLRERYQNAVAGVADESSAELLSLPEQVGAWEKKERETQSTIQQCQQKGNYARAQLKELQQTTRNQSTGHGAILQQSAQLKTEISACENKIKTIKAQDPSLAKLDESTLRKSATALQANVTQLRDQVVSLTARLEATLSFEFRDPERGFDRNRVKGLVARLVKINNRNAATALEIAAGSKLYQVVVDTEQTGKLLLQNGGLRKRVTILPLNKISSRCTEPGKVARAKEVATSLGGNACLALELVGFEEEVRRAMEYTFGSAIVCDNSDIAKAVAFDKNIRTRTVTLDGDTYDPAGTLTGGSKNQLGVLLCKIDELATAQMSLQEQEEQLQLLKGQLKGLEKQSALVKDLLNELELKKHALQICEDKMSDSSYAQSMTRITEIEAELSAIDQEAASAKEQHAKAKEELNKLKSAESNNKKHREAVMKDLEKGVKDSQKVSAALRAQLVSLKNRRDALTAEVKACNAELITIKEQRSISETAVTRLVEEVKQLGQQLNASKAQLDIAKQETAAKNQELNRCSKEIKELEKQREKHSNESKAASLESRKIAHKLKQWEKDSKDAANRVSVMLKQHAWIEKEKPFFGQPGSDFDFNAKDVAQCRKRHQELKGEQDRLAKKINKKVMGMIENAETEYEELNRKRQVIMNDKSKIEAVIEELDVKKSQALQTTWVKVNRDFGSIFSMLLPGTMAKLEPPEGCSVSDGLEVKVAFHDVWKESLTELSGGQRSLLALSLILSLLLFKPAPMYILDEVDAALDLSHTQNIGMMLRTHFSASQFIVVSLKEGMFNNANVIFRTRFVDGISAVMRTVAGGKIRPGMIGGVIAPSALTAGATPTTSSHVVDSEAEDAPKKKKGKAVVVTGKRSGALAVDF